MKKISYLVATYNCPALLDEHIDHLITDQLDPNFEVIIINHDSPSYDLEIAEKWQNFDSRVRSLEMEDYGCYAPAWVYGWKHAEGEYVCNSNTDDFHHSRFTETMYNYMKINEAAFGYAGIYVINEEKDIQNGGIKPPFNLEQCTRECLMGPQVVWRNDPEFLNSLDMDRIWKESKNYQSAFDYWLWLYFMSLGYKGVSVPHILTYYTQRSMSVENSNPRLNNYETLRAISEFFPHHFKEGGKLHDAFPEFSNFKNIPTKEEWINR